MSVIAAVALALLAADPKPAAGDPLKTLEFAGRTRSYLLHVPPKLDPAKPAPLVLVLHGAAMNGPMMALFSGWNKKADEEGFLVAYPNGTGSTGFFLVWNAGGWIGKQGADDVAFLAAVLDDVAKRACVDPRRVYATGMSNGGMMCYRLAAELSDRVAAVAPVAGTQAIENPKPTRPVPLIHFHGTKDALVPFEGLRGRVPALLTFKSVDESIATWVKLNGCPKKPKIESLPDVKDDGAKVQRKTYGPGRDGAEVVLVIIENGGHTWPGRDPPFGFLGKSTHDISANDMIWDFFVKHPKP